LILFDGEFREAIGGQLSAFGVQYLGASLRSGGFLLKLSGSCRKLTAKKKRLRIANKNSV